MKNNDLTKRYKTRFIINLIIAAFISLVLVSLLIFNISRLILYLNLSELGEGVATTLYVIITVLIFGLSFYLLQRKSINYVSDIAAAMNDMAEGNLESSVRVEGDDEFSEMAENLNNLGSDLKKLIESERSQEKSKQELITNIAHDIKTPLTSIIGYLELLSGKKGDSFNAEQKKKYIGIVYNKSLRLEQLINDLFDFSKLSFGKITMNPEYVDLIKLLEQLSEEAYPKLIKKHISFELKSNVDSIEIVADGTLLARLFDNLIENAIKYGEEGKKILVTVEKHDDTDSVEVKVINYGFIIAEKDLPRIFDKFYRADEARSTGTGGTGLGLAIAKDIVEMHGGSIAVKSDLNGTVFTVRLKIHFDKNKENIKRV